PKIKESSLWRGVDVLPFNRAEAFVGLPLIVDQEVIGALFVDFYRTDPLTEEMRYTLLAFARLAASAIHCSQQRSALRDSQERSNLISGLTTDAVYETNPNETVIHWSSGIDHLMRCTPGKFPHDRAAWLNAIHPDDRDRILAAM